MYQKKTKKNATMISIYEAQKGVLNEIQNNLTIYLYNFYIWLFR